MTQRYQNLVVAAFTTFGVQIGLMVSVPSAVIAFGLWDKDHNDAVWTMVFGVIALVVVDMLIAIRLRRHERWEEAQQATTRSLTEGAITKTLENFRELADRMLTAMTAYDSSHAGLERDVRELRARITQAEVDIEKAKKDIEDLQRRNHTTLGIGPR